MGYAIDTIEGIGPAYRAKLVKVGIRTTDGLLKQCCDRKGRRQIADAAGLQPPQLLKWANLADLMRIRGIGRQYSELLEAAGVDTVKELRNRKPDNLTAAVRKVNAAKRLSKSTPSASMVSRWVRQAKALKPVITH